MLEGLFDEEETEPASQKRNREEEKGPPLPPRLRSESGLVGLENQGATCYLNSLIQMLRMTPEFRDAIFKLSPKELGCLSQNGSCQKRRKIPVEMQKLFATLQLAHRESVSTEALTCSFGWNKNEVLFQQDIQELLQVLFTAVRESLHGCSGQNLITDLYGGQQMWKVTCSVCQRESVTVEYFVDVTLALMEATDLEQSLRQLYCGHEIMQLSNQYNCGPCNRPVDATRSTKLRSLPPVLIFTLTRFNFDTDRKQRCKENKSFGYPMELNMAPYMEKSQGDEWYDLFCVVLHRGSSAHGGHYHTFIRDLQCQGRWTEQDKTAEEEDAPPPVETLCRVLECQPDRMLTMECLCSEFSKLAGGNWSKKYKGQWGPFTKFLQENNDVFHYDQAAQSVTLKQLAGGLPCKPAEQSSRVPPAGQAWFDFDDARVTPMASAAVTRQSQRQGCAYMLVYRRRALHTPRLEPPYYGVPEHLAAEVMAENGRLEEERGAYERSVNQLTVELHPACNFECQDGMLSALDPDLHRSVTLDQRLSLAALRSLVSQCWAGLIPQHFTLHCMKRVGGMLHLYQELQGDASSLQTLGLSKQAMLLVWDGHSIHGVRPNCGADSEPVQVRVVSEQQDSCLQVPKNMSFAAFKARVSQQTAIPAPLLLLHRVVGGAKTTLLQTADQAPLSQIPIEDGDQLLAHNSSTQAAPSSQCCLQVENHFPIGGGEGAWTPIQLSLGFSTTVAELKQKILEAYSLEQSTLPARLRVMSASGELQPPVDESLTLTTALISSHSTVVLEPGPCPSSSQVMICYSYKGEDRETMVQRHHTVEQVLKQIQREAKLPGDRWFLRKTDWLGEPGVPLENMRATLEECEIYSGDRVALEMGSPPSKDSIRLEVVLCPTPASASPSPQCQLLRSYLCSALPGGGCGKLAVVEMEKTETLQQLKERILAEPVLAGLAPPVPLHLRLRRLDQASPGSVLPDPRQTIGKCKLAKCGQVAVQLVAEEPRTGGVLLELVQRVPGRRSYGEPLEAFIPAPRGIFPRELRQHLASVLDIPEEFLMTAKYFPTRHEWLIIDGALEKTGSKKGVAVPMNLRQAPFCLQDGDTIGIKDLRQEAEELPEDFLTEEDKVALEKLRRDQENKHNLRMQRRQGEDCRRERGVVIQVDM